MNIDEFVALYKRLMKDYSWKRMYDDFLADDEKRKKGRKPKYIRFSIDTRDGEIWSITFDKSPSEEISFRLDDKGDVEAMFRWLDGADEVI